MLSSIFRRVIRPLGHRFGVEFTRHIPPGAPLTYPVDFSPTDRRILDQVRPFTMTTNENIKVLMDAVRYVSTGGLSGDIVECGLWRGGSSMAAALTLLDCGENDRHLYLYDTFSGMNVPTEEDRFPDGTPAAMEFERTQTGAETSSWCYAPVEEVAANLRSSAYPAGQIHLIKGKVEDTIPGTLPERIALLRLDTDWYESTRHELKHLFPRLVPHGVLIIDDYGYWAGAKQAVDEFLREQNLHFFLHRADQSSRVIINSPAPRPPAV